MATWTFTTKSKGDVEIEWTGNDEAIVRTIADPPEEIGRMKFEHIEGAGYGEEDRYLVTHMFLSGPGGTGEYLHQGIGREIISSLGPVPVTFHVDDGNRRDDGGHLTGDGPAFARAMIAAGLAFWEEGDG